MTTLKEWMNAQWQAPGVRCAGHGVAYMMEGGRVVARAGTARTYKSKAQKAYEARFAIYNKKLAPVILAEATLTDGVYRWPAHTKSKPVVAIPRKRVPKAKLDQAQAILAKVPPDELASFLARFGLSMSLAVSIASLDNLEMVARQFLRATL